MGTAINENLFGKFGVMEIAIQHSHKKMKNQGRKNER